MTCRVYQVFIKRNDLFFLISVVLALFGMVVGFNAAGATGDDFRVEYIELRVGRDGDSFHPVLMGNDEIPYLDIKETVEAWVGVTVDCEKTRLFCQAFIPTESLWFWVDGDNNQVGKSGGEIEEIKSHGIVSHDGRLWVSYEVLSQWLPVTATWSIRSYLLQVIPEFTSTGRRLKELERERERLSVQRMEHDGYYASEPVVPDDRLSVDGLLAYSYQVSDDERGESSLEYNMGADVFSGRFEVGGVVGGRGGGPDYWYYDRYDNAHGIEYIGIGDTRYAGTMLLKAKGIRDSVNIQRHYRAEGVGKFIRREHTTPNSKVDIFKNGFYEKTVEVGESGFYLIDGFNVASGDQIRVRQVSSDGIESQRVFDIAGTSNYYLDRGDWDAYFTRGSEDDSDLLAYGYRYGVWDGFTVGVNAYEVSDRLGEESIRTLQMSLMPAYWLSLSAEKSLLGGDFAYAADITAFKGQSIFIRGLNKPVSESMVGDHSIFSNGKAFEVSHRINKGRWMIETEAFDDTYHSGATSEVTRKLKRDMSVSLGVGYDDYHSSYLNDYAWSSLVGFDYLFSGRNFFSIYHQDSEAGDAWSGSIRLQGEPRKTDQNQVRLPYSIELNADRDRINPLVLSVKANWLYSDYVSFNLSANDEGDWLAGMSVMLGVSKHSGDPARVVSSYQFGAGAIDGYLLVEGVDGEMMPVKNAEVRVSSYRTFTDEFGYYRLGEVPSGYEMDLTIVRSSLGISLIPRNEKTRVKVRPGSTLHYNPAIDWAIGVDGYVDLADSSIKVSLVNELSGAQYPVPYESDGFFVVEGLPAGSYRVLAGESYIDAPEIKLAPGDDWVSGIRIGNK